MNKYIPKEVGNILFFPLTYFIPWKIDLGIFDNL